MKLRLPHWLPHWREWINPIPFAALCLILLFGWYTIFGDQGVLQWRQLYLTKQDLMRTERDLSQQLQHLEQETQRLQDPAYLEPIIRRELGYIKPGERLYHFPDGN